MALMKSVKCRTPSIIVCILVIIIGTTVLYTGFSHTDSNININIKSISNSRTFRLTFITANYSRCQEIVPNIKMSQFYEKTEPEFQQAVNNSVVNEGIEGYSGQVDGQYKTMHYLAGHSHVKTVCETGFNLGHSSFNFLTANEQLIVHSFDLGNHGYAHNMSEYMKKKFPDRFFIHFGDSTQTIPQFIRDNPNFKCDLILVDGGHVYPVALADIRNFAMIANLEENVMLFDDHPTEWGQSFGKAWDDMIKEGVIKEKMRCTFLDVPGLQRGFTIGRVLKKPI